ncbi:sulfotransferase [Persicimonas caeni]|uniref:Sulfotransferase n=2 Tax=Persicimonas caeni TaxID=2292766 RepID=A0A4Y6Q2Q5_PERCE|nr:sulfotransferase [Persicimonas caeni]QED36076.1 sulfotransferase [Persicimonas caeni]
MGNLETKMLADQLDAQTIEAPVYITGLARAGTTILLEIIARHPHVATHQYRDFPFIYTPFWWHQTLQQNAPKQLESAERAHGDRLEVTPESPEAMEEMLWMAFFDGLHDPSQSNVLDADTTNEKFERFYRDHIRKLLLAEGKTRYAAKGNYNVTRLEYLLALFPDARFIVPVRRPQNQVASLRKQHKLFTKAAREHPRSVAHLQRVGHYEFGADRRAINAGDRKLVASVESLWKTDTSADQVRGWARYWAHLYGYLADRLDANPKLRDAVHLVRYEDLCSNTERELHALLDHAQLTDSQDAIVAHYAERISAPSYYSPDFSDEERAAIDEETAEVAGWFGY